MSSSTEEFDNTEFREKFYLGEKQYNSSKDDSFYQKKKKKISSCKYTTNIVIIWTTYNALKMRRQPVFKFFHLHFWACKKYNGMLETEHFFPPEKLYTYHGISFS